MSMLLDDVTIPWSIYVVRIYICLILMLERIMK